jgi:3-methyladenine DNA glycosylase/8-oxoguanine DNA glycosylase
VTGAATIAVEVPPRFELAPTAGRWLGRRDQRGGEVPSRLLRATRTPEGPATVSYRSVPGRSSIEVEAWGPGAAWALDQAPALLGAGDDPSGFAALVADHPLLRRLHRAHPGLRLGRTDRVVEAALAAVCAQKVTGLEAARTWRALVGRFGDPAPGPHRLRLPPDPARLAGAGYFDLHRLGLERRRAETVLAVARAAADLEPGPGGDPEPACRRLRAITGVGIWTENGVRQTAFGDADAVGFGDYHLPNLVSWALAGERQGSDERMAELLAPFPGHRGRVVFLLIRGRLAPPRRGPRLAPSGMERR